MMSMFWMGDGLFGDVRWIWWLRLVGNPSDISDTHATGSTGGARWSTARTMPWSFVKASLPPSVITQQAKYVQACGNWKWITSEFSVFWHVLTWVLSYMSCVCTGFQANIPIFLKFFNGCNYQLWRNLQSNRATSSQKKGLSLGLGSEKHPGLLQKL